MNKGEARVRMSTEGPWEDIGKTMNKGGNEGPRTCTRQEWGSLGHKTAIIHSTNLFIYYNYTGNSRRTIFSPPGLSMLPGTKQHIKIELNDAKPALGSWHLPVYQYGLPYRFTEFIKLPEYQSQIWIQNSKMRRLIAFLPDTMLFLGKREVHMLWEAEEHWGIWGKKLEVGQCLSLISWCCDKRSQQKNLKGERIYLADNSRLQYSPPLQDSLASRNWKQMSDVILSQQQRVMNSCRLPISFLFIPESHPPNYATYIQGASLS